MGNGTGILKFRLGKDRVAIEVNRFHLTTTVISRSTVNAVALIGHYTFVLPIDNAWQFLMDRITAASITIVQHLTEE